MGQKNNKNIHSKPKLNTKHTSDIQFNCEECDFQGDGQIQLRKHVNLKHNVEKDKKSDGVINCRNCSEIFSDKWNLMSHRKEKHLSTVAYCRNNLIGKCTFSFEMCWWNHDEKPTETEEHFKCFLCSELFESRPNMMTHRKRMHPLVIGQCRQFEQKSCRFQSESCWYNHEKASTKKSYVNNKDEEAMEDEDESQQVFRKAFVNPKPPSRGQN